MGYSSLHDAVMDASVTHVMNQMSTGDVDAAASNAGYVGSAPVSEEEGYDQLRDSIDEDDMEVRCESKPVRRSRCSASLTRGILRRWPAARCCTSGTCLRPTPTA